MKTITFDENEEYTGEILEFYQYVCKNVRNFDETDFQEYYRKGLTKYEITKVLNQMDEENREYCEKLDQDPEYKLIFDMSMNY
jgi:hypothetical protein